MFRAQLRAGKRPIRGCQRLTVKASENAILHIDFYNKRMTNGELYLYSDNQSDTCIKRQFWSAFEVYTNVVTVNNAKIIAIIRLFVGVHT